MIAQCYKENIYEQTDTENMVAHNSGTHNNEFIDYVATFSGNYTIKVKQFSAKKTEDIDWCSYTYFIN